MTVPTLTSRAWAIVLAWLALALIFTPQAVLLNLGRPQPLPHWQAAARSAEIFLVWALLSPVVFVALRRWPPVRRNLGRHVMVGIALVAVHMFVLIVSLIPQIDGPVRYAGLVQAVAISVGATNFLMCGGVYAAAIAMVNLDARRGAERALGAARLAALRAQLQPHFLFNTLNALAELVHRDPPLAETLLLRLSTLLRRALDDSASLTIPLGEELGFLEDYLSIQQALLGTRLRIERDIAPGVLGDPVPPLLLQPLVENALRHGIAPRRGGGTLRIAARREDRALRIVIENDADGGPREPGTGIGLRNTRERLETQYGSAASMALDEREPGRFRVTLILPGASA